MKLRLTVVDSKNVRAVLNQHSIGTPVLRHKSRIRQITKFNRPHVETLEHRQTLSTGYGGAFELYTDSSATTTGLTGSYVDQSLQAIDDADWRLSQTISGSRVDPSIFFPTNSFGTRADVGVTGGTDSDWDNFSVQWDGVVRILDADTVLATRSVDGSRMWIDTDQSGTFETGELVNNGWGASLNVRIGDLSAPLPVGDYGIRIQYEENTVNNRFSLIHNPIPQLSGTNPLIVRVGYIIPEQRTPQPNAVANLQDLLPRLQDWYAQQMDRWGLGNKTFQFETEPDGETPLVHTIHVGVTDASIRDDIFDNTVAAAAASGAETWTPGQVWLLIPEAHLQDATGATLGNTALGGSFGSGNNGGVAMVGSNMIFRLSEEMLLNDEPYAGNIIPELGPHALVQDVSFPWFEEDTFSSIASSAQGAVAHELGHAFGLPHDNRNDENFEGNLMGTGLRGIRGHAFPQLYPSDDMRLGHTASLILNTSRYFNHESVFTDNVQPTITVTTSGNVDPVNGLLEINFTASDNIGLAHAYARTGGRVVDEVTLSGTNATGTFRTPIYDVGATNDYQIFITDLQGNRRSVWSTITVNPGHNHAPVPAIKVSPSRVLVGETITLDASRSSDPDDDDNLLTYEWDLDGDGVFDTSPTTNTTHTLATSVVDTFQVTLRVTDPSGAQALSAPLALRVEEPVIEIVDRHIFYNDSSYDGNEATANANDDAAIATDKQALLPGETASFANYTNYANGINGIMVDISHATNLTLNDFEIRVGNDSDPATWPLLAATPTVHNRPMQGFAGSNRVSLVWPNASAVKGNWIQVTVLANANTGLNNDDVFYFGNTTGEVGDRDGFNSFVTAFDFATIRDNMTTVANITSANDFDRDGDTDAADLLIARDNVTNISDSLHVLHAPQDLTPIANSNRGLQATPPRPRHQQSLTGNDSVSPLAATPNDIDAALEGLLVEFRLDESPAAYDERNNNVETHNPTEHDLALSECYDSLLADRSS